MLVRRHEAPILLCNLAYVLVFGSLSVARANYEFVIYTLVIVFFLGLIAATQRRVQFSPFILWGLTLWGFLHMAGGHVPVGAGRLYDVILLPIAAQHSVLRYDQFVHALGFGVATLVCYHLLRPQLNGRAAGWPRVSVLVVLMGMGLGAFNEVLELVVTLIVPESGVGGYMNTAFDLAFNMVGAVLAVVWINLQRCRQGGELPTV